LLAVEMAPITQCLFEFRSSPLQRKLWQTGMNRASVIATLFAGRAIAGLCVALVTSPSAQCVKT
jgi:hypothetical protein